MRTMTLLVYGKVGGGSASLSLLRAPRPGAALDAAQSAAVEYPYVSRRSE